MPNNFLAPRATPRGHGAVVDALNLLTSFGGGSDDLKKMLAETRDAISHNERLIADAQVIVERAKDIQRREDDVTARESVVGAKWKKLEEIREGFAAYDKERARR